jgi:hypothetical protein
MTTKDWFRVSYSMARAGYTFYDFEEEVDQVIINRASQVEPLNWYYIRKAAALCQAYPGSKSAKDAVDFARKVKVTLR